MRAVVQRVKWARVSVAGSPAGQTAPGPGVLVYLGVAEGDTEEDARATADKVAGLRIFPDEAGKFDKSVVDVGGSALVISQFTLMGDCRKGRRPSMTAAARPEAAEPLYKLFGATLSAAGCPVQYGVFGADMAVESLNDGPVTFLIDSRKLF
jgi:D-tyrosyl-tRNA(Tyr) deacylase